MAISPSNTILTDLTTGYINTKDPNKGVIYRMMRCLMPNNPNAAGSGAGESVSVDFTGFSLPLDLQYSVIVTPGVAAIAHVTSKTATGFTVVLDPITAALTLAAGTFDVIVEWQA
jgi:hypothetical protein